MLAALNTKEAHSKQNVDKYNGIPGIENWRPNNDLINN